VTPTLKLSGTRLIRCWDVTSGCASDSTGNHTEGEHVFNRESAASVISHPAIDKIIEGNETSPHPFGFAIDVITGDDSLEVANEAKDLFSRIGFYPGRGFLHLDQAPDNWMNKYMKSRYWVQVAGVYQIFDDYQSARNCAESEL
jgi:hypothetical protein